MNEIFKDIKGYEGFYQVSNLGNVKSINRIITDKNGLKRPINERILKPSENGNGYVHVGLSKNCIDISTKIHRLVAMTFIPNPKNKHDVNHKDGNRSNNLVENLEWVSRRENLTHGQKRANKSSKFIGVCWSKEKKKWTSHIYIDRVLIRLGGFHDENDAYNAYLNALKKYNIKNKYA